MIELDNVCMTYPGSPPFEALKPCSLTIKDGTYLTVTGKSGSGKSTLLNILGLLDTPTGGTYRLNGLDMGSMNEGRRSAVRASQIGFVFQAFNLLPHRSALENVAMASLYLGIPKSKRMQRAVEALERVGLSHRLHALPTTMSGGERQRVAIARGTMGQPKLLLCDEPTGNLDTRTSDSVLQILRDLNREGLTIIVVTHDAVVAAQGNTTAEIRDGQLGAPQTPTDVDHLKRSVDVG